MKNKLFYINLSILVLSVVLFYFFIKYLLPIEDLHKGRVLEHNVTTNFFGGRTYSTIFECEDGYIREKIGLKYYVVPIGDTVYVTAYR